MAVLRHLTKLGIVMRSWVYQRVDDVTCLKYRNCHKANTGSMVIIKDNDIEIARAHYNHFDGLKTTLAGPSKK